MGALPEGDKPRLLDEQKSLKDAQAVWGGTLGVLSAIGLALSPAVAALPFAVGSISVAVLKRKQNAVERVLADPPRFDYETGTRAHRRRYRSGVLGDDQLAIATDQAAIATLRATAYLEASVRADERSQGARIDGRVDLADHHFQEARHLFELAMKWSGEMAVALDTLALSWAAFAVNSSIDELPLPDDIAEGNLPPEARTTFDRTGLVTDDLELTITQPEGIQSELRAGPRTVGDLALDSAVITRELSQSADRVARGKRALPRRAGIDAEPLSSTVENRRELQQDDLEKEKQRLLPVAERGSANAMFDLGAVAHALGDHADARTWLNRAAALHAPLPPTEYLHEVELTMEYEQLISPRELESALMMRGLAGDPDAERVTEYWRALSENGRKIFRGAAQIERQDGTGYSLDDIGENLGLSAASVRSMHRSTGRTAKSWRRETGTQEPIRLVAESYKWDEDRKGYRTAYRLPAGIAKLIGRLEDQDL